MSSILTGIAILSGLLVLLLAIPIDLAFKINRIQQISGHVSIRWLFGLVGFRINIPDTAKTGKTTTSNHLKNRKSHKIKSSAVKKQQLNAPRFFSALKQSAFRRRFIRFIKDLLRAAHTHELFFCFRIGLGDPADTGQLWALLGPVAAIAANIRSAVVRIEPEFINPAFEMQSHGKFRLIPIQFIALVIAFALSPPSIRVWRSLRQN